MSTGTGTARSYVTALVDIASRGRQRDGAVDPGGCQVTASTGGDVIRSGQGHDPDTSHVHIHQNIFARALGIEGDVTQAATRTKVVHAGRCVTMHQQMGRRARIDRTGQHRDRASPGRQRNIAAADGSLRQAHHFHVTRDLRFRQALPGSGHVDAQHNIVVTPVLNVNVFGLDRIQTDSGLCTHHQLQAADGFTELCVFAAGVGLNYSAYG